MNSHSGSTYVAFQQRIDLRLDTLGLAQKTFIHCLFFQSTLSLPDPINLRIPEGLRATEYVGVVMANVRSLGLD